MLAKLFWALFGAAIASVRGMTGRSFGLSVWSMSQLIADYERSEHGVRALDNAATVLQPYRLRSCPRLVG